jgi:hypothetical protein
MEKTDLGGGASLWNERGESVGDGIGESKSQGEAERSAFAAQRLS